MIRILAICSANMCRSPMSAGLLNRALIHAPIADKVMVSSCGLQPVDESICEEILSRRLSEADVQAIRKLHRPTQLTVELAGRANLLLAADRAVRTGVVRLDPQLHSITFTLREAATLAGAVLSDPLPHGNASARTLDWFVDQMNQARGVTGLARVENLRVSSRSWRRTLVHSHDIPDAHKEPGVPHTLVRRLLISSVDDLATSLLRAMT